MIAASRDDAERTQSLALFLRQIRPKHWVKNTLVFLPVVCAHRFDDLGAWLSAATAFVFFSAGASGQYLLNDLRDLRGDREHPEKRHRPLAAAQISLALARIVAIFLILGSTAAGWLLQPGFAVVLGAYHLLAMAYSYRLRSTAMADVVLLAGLYATRVFAGGAVTDIIISPWLLSFSLFLFFSLALLKRFSEIRQNHPGYDSQCRPYTAMDTPVLLIFGVASGTISVLVLALYLQHPLVATLYRHPERLSLLCPLLMFWIARLWLQANRGDVDEDPLVFVLGDVTSYVVLAAASVIVVLSLIA